MPSGEGIIYCQRVTPDPRSKDREGKYYTYGSLVCLPVQSLSLGGSSLRQNFDYRAASVDGARPFSVKSSP